MQPKLDWKVGGKHCNQSWFPTPKRFRLPFLQILLLVTYSALFNWVKRWWEFIFLAFFQFAKDVLERSVLWNTLESLHLFQICYGFCLPCCGNWRHWIKPEPIREIPHLLNPAISGWHIPWICDPWSRSEVILQLNKWELTIGYSLQCWSNSQLLHVGHELRPPI